GMEISFDDLDEDIREALRAGDAAILEESEAAERLPRNFTKTFFPSKIALLPVQAGNELAGVVLVDNKHNGKPLKKVSLDNLRTLLANAGVVWETLRERKRSEDLLNANYEILGGARRMSLPETLRLICKTARAFSRADWVSVYPFPRHVVPPNYEFDFKNVGMDGELKSGADLSQEQPCVGGVSMYVLQNGELIVNDVEDEDPMIGETPLSERQFIRREGIKALAGIAIRDPDTPEKLGILYLDYFAPHRFTETEIRHAQSFARLAAVAISNARSLDERHSRAILKTTQRISEAAGVELNLEEVMSRILTELKIFFHGSSLCVLLYDKEEDALEFAPQTLRHYQILNPEFEDVRTFPLSVEKQGSIACKVARITRQTRKEKPWYIRDVKSDPDYLPLNPNTVAEVCVSFVDRSGELLGVLALERETQFEEEDIQCIKIAARLLGQAIERAQQSDQLAFKSMVANMTAWASDIAHDIKSEVAQIRGNAYLLKQNIPSPQMLRWVNEIEESVKRLADAGLLKEQARREIPLDSSLERFLNELTRDKDIKLETRLQAPGAYIKWNPHQLKQILRHLVRNSARAMQDCEDKRIFVETRLLTGGKAEIRFTDCGAGFPEEIRGAVFRRAVTTKDGDGGYGLLLTRQLVEEGGGEISLRPSAPGQGAVFSIKLPLCDTPDVDTEREDV
ncbi:MAG: GAF domain-containing protein, partial [Chloroflexi bacterium]|nr:GAF domain-containing protein [Chloroflexota bacterium]